MKTALVLSGGGAKGSMQLGIFKYLYEQGLRPDMVYGTSVGSLNACGYAYMGVPGLLDFWAKIKTKSDVFKFNWLTLILRSQGIFNANPLRTLIQECVKNKAPTLPCYACTVDLVTGQIKYGKGGEADFVDYVVASASVPGLCEPIKNMVDGGVREQSPLKKAIEDGAQKIVVILCNPWQEDPSAASIGNWISNILRTTDIMSHEIFLNDIKECSWYNEHLMDGKRKVEIVVYAPSHLVIDTHDFTQAKIQPAIAFGYEEAKKGPVFTNG